ncbi:MAG: GNAT family N-acetyltransferase [Chloroflexota bacterium]
MNYLRLHTLFNPKSVAVIGASDTPGSVGYALFKNLTTSGFSGKVYPVNPNREHVQGMQSYPCIAAVPQQIDLAMIATRASTVPDMVQECADSHALSAVVISAGFSEAGEEGIQLIEQIKHTVEGSGMALLGPNCLGFLRPKLNLNASFSRKMPHKGGIAFISQSGALCSAVLDWSVKEHVGFSYFVSVGEMADIGFHDLIDYFGSDVDTKAILIYMETLKQARSFMSAARSFARTKPIIVLKVGRSQEGAKAALYHTGSITGNNQVFDAIFKRAGVLRVGSIAELFDCGKNLAMQRRPAGNRLAIVTNAGGPGVIATDALIDQGGTLANLSPETLNTLNERMPRFWSHANPVDMLADADPQRYSTAVKACLRDPDVDGVLALLTPQAMTHAAGVARELVKIAKDSYKTLLASFMGEDDVADGRRILVEGKIPAYEKPEDAVRSFLNMVEYQRNLRLLAETPATIPHAFTPNTGRNKKIIGDIAASGRIILTAPEVKEILSNYDIPVPKGGLVQNPRQARALADKIGFPVIMKIVSPDIIYERDVRGVISDIQTEEEIDPAYDRIMDAVRRSAPDARILGVYVEEMLEKRYELLIGSKKDPIFGPVIYFGMGGVAVDVFKDTNIGIPPLNMSLAQQLIDGTRISTLLKGYRDAKAVDVAAIQFLLYKFAYLVMDFPQISEIDINPFAVDEHGGIVLDAKIILDEQFIRDEKEAGKIVKPFSHMVICPYPKEYKRAVLIRGGRSVYLRPIRPEDEPMHEEMFSTFSPETRRFRFFGPVKESHEMLAHYTQIDYDREIAIIAELTEGGRKRMAGVVRLIADPYNETAEYAIVIGDPWQKQGLGTVMTRYILEIARARGIKQIYAYLLEDNAEMLKLFLKFNFTQRQEEDMIRVDLLLDSLPVR